MITGSYYDISVYHGDKKIGTFLGKIYPRRNWVATRYKRKYYAVYQHPVNAETWINLQLPSKRKTSVY